MEAGAAAAEAAEGTAVVAAVAEAEVGTAAEGGATVVAAVATVAEATVDPVAAGAAATRERTRGNLAM